MIRKNLNGSAGALALLAAMAVVSCGGKEEEDEQQTLPPMGSIVGVWQITESGFVSHVRCAPPPNGYILYVTQNGSAAIAQTGFDTTLPFDPTLGSNGAQFTGTLNGSVLGIQGANPDGAGTMQSAMAVTVASSCNSFTGGRSLRYTEGGFSCFSVTSIGQPAPLAVTGTRLVGTGCAGNLTPTAVSESATPHGDAASAQAIATLPAAISGTLAVTGEEDWYSFMLAGNAPVTVLLNGPAAPENTDLYLTDNAGTTQLASSTSGSGGTIASSRDAIANTLAAGTYKVRVRAIALTTPASYTLIIQ